MRPRINTFGRITKKELESYLNENQVYGFTAKIKDTFRNTRQKPEMLFVEVSKASKLVLGSWTNKGVKFNNIEDLKQYIKK